MSSDAWPSPDAQPGPLPRIEDLPIAEQGYEQEAVRAAFDSFYRHAAQLDASLSALEAVEVFRRDADALRNDLRAIRALSLGTADDPTWATDRYERVRPEISTVALRLVAEAALIIAVAVVAGVSHLANTTIVILMAAAFVIVACSEWLAARARYVAPAEGFIAGDLLEPTDPRVVVVAVGEVVVDRRELLVREQGRSRGHGRHAYGDLPNAHERFTYFVNFYATSAMLRMWQEQARGTARIRRAATGTGS